MTKEEVCAKIRAFSELKYNWESYHADRISPHAIEAAIKYVLEHDEVPQAVPLPDGGVQLEYGEDEITVYGKNLIYHGDVLCWHCGEKGAVHTRQNTRYVDDEQNYEVLCPVCQEERDKYWQEMWEEYYAGQMILP